MDEELLKVLLPFAQAYHRLLLFGGFRSDSRVALVVGDCETELLAAVSRGSLESALVVAEKDELLQAKHLQAVYDFLQEQLDDEAFSQLGSSQA